MNTLLIIEDDPALSIYLASALESEGYQTICAHSRQEALVITPQPALILLDLGLPPATSRISEGLLLIDALITRAPNSKIIVLTGQKEESAAYEAIRHGAFDFLTKPVPLNAIKIALQRAQLFLRQEEKLHIVGETRIQITVKLADGPKEASAAIEEQLVRSTLSSACGNVTEAAKRLGLAREHLYYYIKKYGIQHSR